MNMSSRSYLVIGCGRFGSRAVRELLRREPLAEVTAVDKRPKALEPLSELPVRSVRKEALSFLERFVSEENRVDYVIPAVPFHLAFEFLLKRLKPQGARRGRIPPLPGLPNPWTGSSQDLYTSLADFLCPEDCPAPARHCSVTGQKRPKPLNQILSELKGAFHTEVILSEQLGRGVGGFRLETLLHLEDRIKEYMKEERQGLLLLSTASRCHGVTSCLSW